MVRESRNRPSYPKKMSKELSIRDCLGQEMEVQALCDEMSEWVESMDSNGITSGSKYDTISQSAETLETQASDLDHVVIELISHIGERTADHVIGVNWTEARRPRLTRGIRMTRVIAQLHAAHEFIEDHESFGDSDSDIRDLLDELASCITELETVEFPSMMG